MCGRYTHLLTWRQIVRLYGLTDSEEPYGYVPRYNIAPSQRCLVIRNGETDREPAMLEWGLIPFWSKKRPAKPFVNAESETVAVKSSFRGPFKSHRCLVPASGFFEWRGERAPKLPFWIGMADDRPFSLAGIWDRWKSGDGGEPVETFAIITCEPNALMASIHKRMPVIVASGDYDAWLTAEPAGAQNLLRPYPPKAMKAYPISKR